MRGCVSHYILFEKTTTNKQNIYQFRLVSLNGGGERLDILLACYPSQVREKDKNIFIQ